MLGFAIERDFGAPALPVDGAVIDKKRVELGRAAVQAASYRRKGDHEKSAAFPSTNHKYLESSLTALDAPAESWELELAFADADENEWSAICLRLALDLDLDADCRHDDKNPDHRDETGEMIAEASLQPVAHPNEGNVGADRAGIEKYSFAGITDVRHHRRVAKRHFCRFGQVRRDPMVEGEMVESSGGQYGELDVGAAGNARGRADSPVPSRDNDSGGSVRYGFSNLFGKPGPGNLPDIETARRG